MTPKGHKDKGLIEMVFRKHASCKMLVKLQEACSRYFAKPSQSLNFLKIED